MGRNAADYLPFWSNEEPGVAYGAKASHNPARLEKFEQRGDLEKLVADNVAMEEVECNRRALEGKKPVLRNQHAAIPEGERDKLLVWSFWVVAGIETEDSKPPCKSSKHSIQH